MKKQKKQKLSTPNRQSIRHIVNNNLYMLKIVMHVVPEMFFMPFLHNAINVIFNFLTGTWLLRYIINGFQTGLSFLNIITVTILLYGIALLFNLLSNAYINIRSPILDLKLNEHINRMIFRKNSEVELACYEDPEFYDKYVKATSNIISRINQVMRSVSMLFNRMFSVAMYTYVIIVIDPFLMLFTIPPIIMAFTVSKKHGKIAHELDMKRQEEIRQRDYTRRTFYLSDFAKEMRMTEIYKVMFERFNRSVKNIIAYTRQYGIRLSILDYIINETREVLSFMGAMLYAIYRTLVSGTMLYGDCLVVLNTIQRVFSSIITIADELVNFYKNSLYIDTVREFLEYEPKIKDGPEDAPQNGDLCVNKLCFRYPGQEKDVLHNVSFTLKKGEKIALVGHNGAGKSTLVKLLLRLYDPTDGEICYDGRDIREYKLTGDGGYRERFAVVFQDFKLFSMSVADNILLRRRMDGDDALVKQALHDSGSFDKVQSFEKGADTILTREFDDSGEVLSGGEGQKISIARAFTKDSSILLLDEPSSALDPVAEYQMYETLMRACKDKSVVFISHRMSSAVLADRILLLDNGEIIEEGSHSELMAKDGKYAQLFRVQAQNYISEGQEVRT